MINKDILTQCCDQEFKEKELYEAYKIFFKTLVSESRLRILNLLRKERKNVSEITKELDLDQTVVSHNLRRLKKCGFVESEIKGKYRYYNINKKTLKPLMDHIDKHMSSHCIHILRENKSKEKKKK